MTTDSTGTGSESQDEDQTGGSATGSQGEDGKAPGDGWVKKSQLIAALNSATAKTDAAVAKAEAVERELQALRAEREKEKAPKPPTQTELRQLVEAGELTQSQADALWQKHLDAQVDGKVRTGVETALAAQERQRRVDAELLGYREVVGEAWVEGTPERAKAAKEYQYLVSLGSAPTKETEAIALRAAFGDLDTLRASKSSARTGSAETHSETGGSRPAGGDSGGKDDAPKDLTPKQKAHYERLIQQGIYAGWDEVKAEIKEAKPRARAR